MSPDRIPSFVSTILQLKTTRRGIIAAPFVAAVACRQSQSEAPLPPFALRNDIEVVGYSERKILPSDMLTDPSNRVIHTGDIGQIGISTILFPFGKKVIDNGFCTTELDPVTLQTSNSLKYVATLGAFKMEFGVAILNRDPNSKDQTFLFLLQLKELQRTRSLVTQRLTGEYPYEISFGWRDWVVEELFWNGQPVAVVNQPIGDPVKLFKT